MSLNEHFKKKEKLLLELHRLLNCEEIDHAKEVMENYDSEYDYDLEWCSIKANILFNQGNTQEAKNILLNLYKKYSLNGEINYNLGVFSYYLGEFEEMILYLSKIIFCDNKNESLIEQTNYFILSIKEILPDSKEKFYAAVKKTALLFGKEHTIFPCYSLLDKSSEMINDRIGKSFKIGKEEFLCGLDDDYVEERIGYSFRDKYKERLIYGTTIHPANKLVKAEVMCTDKVLIPLMPTVSGQEVVIGINGDKIPIISSLKERFYYYTFQKGDFIDFYSDKEFWLGNPIWMKQKKGRPKVVLSLFIDGLPQVMLQEGGLFDNMPHTYHFFKKGTICSEAFSKAEWTLPSVASIFSGTGVLTHRIYHPEYSNDNLYDMPLFTEVFKDAGYNCAMIDGNWRTTPIVGYAKGMNRILYRDAIYGMSASEVVNKITEHLEIFSKCDNFIWASFMDLHGVGDEYELPLDCQANMPLNLRNNKKTDSKSVEKKYSEIKKDRLKYAMRSLDNKLNQLYLYLEANYKNQYLVSLVSDHGQGYLIPQDGEFLSEERTNIAMMFVGGNAAEGNCSELMESVDYFPALLMCTGIQKFDIQEGNIPIWFGGEKERTYTFTESVYPEKPYYGCINTKGHIFFLKTEKNCTNDGMIDMSGYSVKLIEKKTKLDITKESPQIVASYTDIVLEHIKNFLMVI